MSISISNVRRLDSMYPGWVDDPRYVYVGRWAKYQRRGIDLGNRHAMVFKVPCPLCSNNKRQVKVFHTREEAVKLYASDPLNQAYVGRLRREGKFEGLRVLVCHCKSDKVNPNLPCHADVIREWLEPQGKLF